MSVATIMRLSMMPSARPFCHCPATVVLAGPRSPYPVISTTVALGRQHSWHSPRALQRITGSSSYRSTSWQRLGRRRAAPSPTYYHSRGPSSIQLNRSNPSSHAIHPAATAAHRCGTHRVHPARLSPALAAAVVRPHPRPPVSPPVSRPIHHRFRGCRHRGRQNCCRRHRGRRHRRRHRGLRHRGRSAQIARHVHN